MPPPRPTLGDIDLPPRRRLRDGSRSSTSSRSALGAPIVGVRGRRGGRGRGRSASTLSTLSNATSALSSVPSTTSGLRSAIHSRSQSIHVDDDGNTPEPELNIDIRGNDNEEYQGTPYDFSNSNFFSPPSPGPESRPRIDHGSTLIDMLDDINQPGDASSSSSSNPNPNPIDSGTGRRYTAAEKGKGKAAATTTTANGTGTEPISISDEEEGDESIQVIGVKRKAEEVDLVDDQSPNEDEKEQEAPDDQEEHRLAAYTAIARNPHAQAFVRPKPKSRRPKKKEPQPVEWTAHQLQETWQTHRQAVYEQTAREAGMDEDSIAAGRDTSEVSVEQVLKGLWKVEQRYWVVEGECPVCRKGLPGGYGPDESGIGAVIPLCPAVRSGPPPSKHQGKVTPKEQEFKEAAPLPKPIRIILRNR